MCCYTHDNPSFPGELAASDQWRCRCPMQDGLLDIQPCSRKATAEDLLCDICSGRTLVGADPARTYGQEELHTDGPMPSREQLYNEYRQTIDWGSVKIDPPSAYDAGVNVDAAIEYIKKYFPEGGGAR